MTVFLDSCHLVKLVRNTPADEGCLLDEKSNRVSWDYILNLPYLQESEGLHLGNKLRNAHAQ